MANNKFSKILTIVAVIISLVAIFFYIMILSKGDGAFDAKEVGQDVALDNQNNIISPYVWVTIIVLVVTIFFAVLSSLLNLAKKPEQLKKTLLSVGVLGIVLVVAYLLNDPSEVLDAQGKVLDGGATGETSNVWSSTGIWYSVILGGVGLALFLVDMVKSLVKS